ncbi:MAG TPA: hypothetical protein VFM88_08620 [Vicinamibacteria bacterium]|nr:hypothetical protein [Vicinamibacteria bacterium]
MLLKKFFNVGFEGIAVLERRGCGLEDLERYPLFAPQFLDFLRKAIPSHRHAEIASAVAITARRPAFSSPKED